MTGFGHGLGLTLLLAFTCRGLLAQTPEAGTGAASRIGVTELGFFPLRFSGQDEERARRYLASELGALRRMGPYGVGAASFAGTDGSAYSELGGTLRIRRWLGESRSLDLGVGGALQIGPNGELDVVPVGSVTLSVTRVLSAKGLLLSSPSTLYVGGSVGSRPGVIGNAIVGGGALLLILIDSTVGPIGGS